VPRRVVALLACTAAVVGAVACGDDGDPVADQRADQLRAAAAEAGLDGEVADLLALAASATGATFRVSYPGEDGGELVVSQRPPHRRIDTVEAGVVIESRIVRGAVGYLCLPVEDEELVCTREAGAIRAPGIFTADALEQLTVALGTATEAYELRVEERTLVGTTAHCLVAELQAGAEAPARGDLGTLCLSPEGAQLLVDTSGERLEASDYSTDVPSGVFDPDDP
jgi:hypothetical protein